MTTRTIDRFPLLLALASALVLGSALASQYIGGLQPCVLCIWQRWPYVAAIVLALAALAVGRRAGKAALTALAGVALLVGTAIAVFHVGVEQHWWQGLAGCSGAVDFSTGSVADIRAQLAAAPVVRCDAVAWSFLGLSMAGWNVLVSLALGVAALAAATRIGRGAA